MAVVWERDSLEPWQGPWVQGKSRGRSRLGMFCWMLGLSKAPDYSIDGGCGQSVRGCVTMAPGVWCPLLR